MDIRLLKKIRKNWTIIHYQDITLKDYGGTNGFIYRALFNGKKVDYAWGTDLHDLIVRVAYAIKYGYEVFRFDIQFNQIKLERQKHKGLNKNGLPKKFTKVWP